MATTVTETPGAEYTWDTAPFTWDSDQAGLRNWDTAHVSAWAVGSTETVVVAEATSKGISVALSELIALQELVQKSYFLLESETLNFSESYLDQIAFYLRVFETVNFLEVGGRNVTIQPAESFSLSEDEQKALGLNKLESLSLLEAFGRVVSFTLNFDETVDLTDDGSSRNVTIYKEEDPIGVSDSNIWDIGLGKKELLGFAEAFGRTVEYTRAIAENLTIEEATSRAIDIQKAEALRIVEALLRNPNAVVSDMLVSNQDITFQDFLRIVNTGRIPGYSDFRTFVQGDYEYSEAMFRVLMDATSSDRGSITDLKVSVDVPDVFDRGVAFIEDAEDGLYVMFTRPFHITPEMSMLLKGGTTLAFPRLITLDQYGFTVKLFDKNDVAVTGSVSWSAHGY